MKFLKNNKKTILAVGATAVICISGTAFAAFQYNAKQVEYKDEKSVEDALNELYTKYNLNEKEFNSFGGLGTSFNGFKVGHKYIGIYFSNFWGYSKDFAYINSGAKNIKILASGITEARTEITAAGAMVEFEATAEQITITSYPNTTNNYGMYFIEL